MSDTRRFATFVRAQIAGFQAASVQAAATYLHGKFGARLVPASMRMALRHTIERSVGASVTGEIVALSAGSRAMAEAAASRGAAQLASHGARAMTGVALRQVVGGVGRASAAGFVVDGVVGGVEAYRGFRAGEMSSGEAWRHVGIEGVTGAIACGAGVALAAGAVVATGGLAPAAVLAIGAVSSTGVKLGLRKVVGRPSLRPGKTPEPLPVRVS